MIIGLTGAYCAGKNHVAALIEARGLPVLDVDKLGHKAIELEKDKIIALFGLDSLDSSYNSSYSSNNISSYPIDRRLLGQIVYKNPEKLAALEAIVHPMANHLTEEWAAAQSGHCVVNAALLHRSSMFSKLDKIILVKAPFLTRLFRARKRDKLPWREIFKRFKSQKDFYTQYLSINAKAFSAEIHIVENPGIRGTLKLERRIDKILEGIV